VICEGMGACGLVVVLAVPECCMRVKPSRICPFPMLPGLWAFKNLGGMKARREKATELDGQC